MSAIAAHIFEESLQTPTPAQDPKQVGIRGDGDLRVEISGFRSLGGTWEASEQHLGGI